MARLLSVNFNRIGPQSSGNLEQINKEINKIDGLIISSPDATWNAKNKMIMNDKLKSANSNVIVNTSDSGEEVEKRSCFLKGGTLAAL